jgi:hypothetical protein
MNPRHCPRPATLLKILAGAATTFLLSISPAAADFIHSFETEIVLAQDGSIEITDRIFMRVAGDPDRPRFLRPVWRLPETWGDVEVIEVLRDGEPENWRLLPTGILTSADSDPLPADDYLYRIKFRIPNAITFLSKRDRLTLYVAGDSARLTDNSVMATIVLPEGATLISAGYDGRSSDIVPLEPFIDGAGRRILRLLSNPDARASTKFLVTLDFEPGFFEPPSNFGRIVWDYLRGNPVAGLTVLLTVVAYYLLYMIHGRPRRDRSNVPSDPLSPAEVSFLMRRKFEATALLAGILSLVAKGHANLRTNVVGQASIEPALERRQGAPLSGDEAALYKSLFGKGETGLSLAGHADQRLTDAAIAHKAQVEKRCTLRTPLDRRRWLVVGYALALVGTLIVGATSAGAAYGLHIAAAYASWATLFVLFVWFNAALIRALRRGERGITVIAAFFAPFVALYLLYHTIKWFPVALDLLGIAGPAPILLSVAFTLVSFIVLRTRLDVDQTRRAQIDKLRQRLAVYRGGVAGSNAAPRITQHDPFLPYAVALGVPHPGFEALVHATRRLSETSPILVGWRAGDDIDGQMPGNGIFFYVEPPPPR